MRTVKMDVPRLENVLETLKDIFARIAAEPDVCVELSYHTMYSAGKFIITKNSNYQAHAAAYERAQRRKGEFASTPYGGVVIGP
jgi:hypothetical protein